MLSVGDVSLEELFCGNVTNIMKHTGGSVQLYEEMVRLNLLDIQLYLHALGRYCRGFMRGLNAACRDPRFAEYHAALLRGGGDRGDYVQTCHRITAGELGGAHTSLTAADVGV